jgi:hypothetical protein
MRCRARLPVVSQASCPSCGVEHASGQLDPDEYGKRWAWAALPSCLSDDNEGAKL